METIVAMLRRYNFDCYRFEHGKGTIAELSQELSQKWQDYDLNWVRLAAIEALYQGRYKIISVDYILKFWQRRGEPQCRFSHDFERLICSDFQIALTNLPSKVTYKSQDQVLAKSISPQARTAYSSAFEQMQLLAESSLFVDKLKSFCSPILPEKFEPKISELEKFAIADQTIPEVFNLSIANS